MWMLQNNNPGLDGNRSGREATADAYIAGSSSDLHIANDNKLAKMGSSHTCISHKLLS